MNTEQKNASNQDNGHRKHQTIVKYSKIAVIDRIYDLEKDGAAFGMGHYIPDIWSRVFLDERGHPHWLAMVVFGEIWFRHRPLQSRQSRDNGDTVIVLAKGFNADRYQFNRAEIAFRLNTSADAISRVLTYLEKLGVIERDHADTDFNHRGFRNVTYITPIVDKLLELVAETEKIVNKNHPNLEIDENAHNSDRRDVGDVAPMMPVTLPTSSRQRGPHDASNVAQSMGAVSRESSEESSVSAVFAAQPQKHLETNNSNNTSAPQAAQPGVGVVNASGDWEAPPPKPTGKDGGFANLEEKVKTIRYQVGKSYQVWYGQKPDISAKEFEDLLASVNQELGWSSGDLIAVIQAGWLWAIDAPKNENGKTFIKGFFSKKCDGNLRALFGRDAKKNKLFLWHICQELKTQAPNEYDIELGNMTKVVVDAWWEEEMLERGVIQDESKYYDDGGCEIRDPTETTWTGIRMVVDRWFSRNQPDRKPEPKWIEAVIQRLKRDAGANIHREHREEVERVLKEVGLLPADFASELRPRSRR